MFVTINYKETRTEDDVYHHYYITHLQYKISYFLEQRMNYYLRCTTLEQDPAIILHLRYPCHLSFSYCN